MGSKQQQERTSIKRELRIIRVQQVEGQRKYGIFLLPTPKFGRILQTFMEICMDYLATAFAISGLTLGLLAARCWFRSSKITAAPAWDEAIAEPVDAEDKNADWIVAILDASEKSAALSRRAAVLTAYAVVLSTLAGVLSSLAAYWR